MKHVFLLYLIKIRSSFYVFIHLPSFKTFCSLSSLTYVVNEKRKARICDAFLSSSRHVPGFISQRHNEFNTVDVKPRYVRSDDICCHCLWLDLKWSELGGLVDGGCEMVACGHGNCKVSSDSLLGFDCECHPGWTKFQIGRLVFPSCVIPNCESLSLSPNVLINVWFGWVIYDIE